MAVLALTTACMFAQSDRGVITGTVSDPGNAVVPNAQIIAKNMESGAIFQTVTTATGNYTLPSVPAGTYEVSVEAPGFSKIVQQGITVQVALTVRLDMTLKVGSTTETVTVSAEAPMLRTENAESSVNVTGDRINSLPLNFGGGAGAIGAIRSQMAFIVLSPGVSGSGTGARVNGFSGNTFRVMIDGQDTTSGNTQARVDETQASVEAIEEFTLQTSNFSAEFGQALGGIFNFTIRSGTNNYHGSLFNYMTNEALNGRTSFTHVLAKSRKFDFGGTIGGPVRIPKIYNGQNKTFFFFNWEYFRNKVAGTGIFQTVPTDAFRNGDFSAALTNRTLATDGLGRAVLENSIYDPQTSRTVNGAVYRDVFPGNKIPSIRFDPVAVAVQKLIPTPINGGLTNNWTQDGIYVKSQSAPAFKIDHTLSEKDKLSFYYGYLTTVQKSGFDSLPIPITATRYQYIYSHTMRLNYDRSISPTVLLHLGSGFIRYLNPDSAAPDVLSYDAVKGLGFNGSATTPSGFPRLTGLGNGTNSAFGGMSLGMGPANANYYYNDKWTSVASVNYIHGNHSYKLGAEMRIDIFTDRNSRNAQGNMTFSNAQTGLPALQGVALPSGTAVGLNYASFLLGLADTALINAVQDPQWRKTSYGMYLQDTWKVTRKLTLDYGLRWDFEDPGHEIWDRVSTLGFSTPNPSAGGLKGAVVYAGHGAGRCNCELTPKYPYAIGPRLGVAYQLDPKTVIRGGWGISYGNLAGLGYITNSVWNGVGFNSITWNAPGAGDPAIVLRNGLQYSLPDLYKATLDPGALPTAGSNVAPAVILDPSWGRPPRINQWSIGIQREVMRNLVVEGAYVGNRAVWLNGPGMAAPNAITADRLAAAGLNLANAADRTLLTSRMDNAAVIARGFKVPYAAFPLSNTLAQALRPYPQFNSNLTARNAALGNSWYDSLQMKVTKRYSRGLDFTVAFTWQKELDRTSAFSDPFNRVNQKRLAASGQPLVLVTGFNYEVQKWTQNRMVNAFASGWTIGGLLRYTSGIPLTVANSSNQINTQLGLPAATLFNRVPGEPLYLKDLNCHCIDPNKDLVLNPKAWVDAAPGTYGVSNITYGDYRGQRFPDEQMSIGRNFRIKENKIFSIRAEFFNVFNRTVLAAPVATSPTASITTDPRTGALTGGFGFSNPVSAGQPRNGQLVARFQF